MEVQFLREILPRYWDVMASIRAQSPALLAILKLLGELLLEMAKCGLRGSLMIQTQRIKRPSNEIGCDSKGFSQIVFQ